MTSVEISSSWGQIGLVVLSSLAILIAVVAFVRIIGLRSFSKMSSFDFAVTVAMGSLLASVALSGSALVEGVVAIGALLGTQYLIALGRRRRSLSKLVDNTPVLLMMGSQMLDGNMRRARVTRQDVLAKLREANVLRLTDVRYVVLETTGDVSVVHGDPDTELDPELLDDVRDGHRLFSDA